jgi:hypothetical protein
MIRRGLVFALALGCGGDRAERPDAIDTVTVDTPAPGSPARLNSLVPVGRSDTVVVPGRSDTTRWADTTRRGDTTFHSRGRVITSSGPTTTITTTLVLTDSQWVVRPAAPLGIPYGPAAMPPDSLCRRATLGYTATILPVQKAGVEVLRSASGESLGVARSIGAAERNAQLLATLRKIQDCGATVSLRIARAALKDSNNRLSVATAHRELATWPDLTPFLAGPRPTVFSFHLGDDVERDEEWGYPVPTLLAMWDTIARPLAERHPGTPRVLRALATQMAQRPAEGRPDSLRWRWMTTALAQYAGPVRHRPPGEFVATQVATAKRLKLGLLLGINLINGGCGPRTGRHPAALAYACLPGIPGDSFPGDGSPAGRYQLSAIELAKYGEVQLREPYSCGNLSWSWGENFGSNFHKRADIRAAALALGGIAQARPFTSCIRR